MEELMDRSQKTKRCRWPAQSIPGGALEPPRAVQLGKSGGRPSARLVTAASELIYAPDVRSQRPSRLDLRRHVLDYALQGLPTKRKGVYTREELARWRRPRGILKEYASSRSKSMAKNNRLWTNRLLS